MNCPRVFLLHLKTINIRNFNLSAWLFDIFPLQPLNTVFVVCLIAV